MMKKWRVTKGGCFDIFEKIIIQFGAWVITYNLAINLINFKSDIAYSTDRFKTLVTQIYSFKETIWWKHWFKWSLFPRTYREYRSE